MSQKVLVNISLKFFQTLESWNISDEIDKYTEDYEYIMNEISNGNFSSQELEKLQKEANLINKSITEINLYKLSKEVEEGPSKKRINNHFKNNYKLMLQAILKNSQIDSYYDDTYEPVLESNVIKFQMIFPENYTKNEIKETVIEGLEITYLNMSDTLLKWQRKLFTLNSNFAPIFELGYFEFDVEKIKFKFN